MIQSTAGPGSFWKFLADFYGIRTKSRFSSTGIPPAPGFAPDGGYEVLRGAQSLLASEFFSLLVSDNATQPLDIGCQHRKRHRSFKTSLTVIQNPVQPAMLKMIDRRLNTRVFLSSFLKPLLRLVLRSYRTLLWLMFLHYFV